MSVFIPNLMIDGITSIKKELLDQYDIKGIILDVDNTLTHHGSQEITKDVADWLCYIKEQGIKLMIVSNNTDKRVKPFANKIGVDYVAMSLKPVPRGFKIAQKRIGLDSKSIAVVGDQIYTDVVGGNLNKMFTILVPPFEEEKQFFLKLKRKFEKRHIRKYKKLKER